MYTSFNIPKGFSAPDGVKEGTEFSEIATFKIKDGKMHIVGIGQDNIPVESKMEKANKPKGAKQAMKEQLMAMEDKKGSASMEEEDMEEMEEESDEEEEMV
jgi:hypothetical protein